MLFGDTRLTQAALRWHARCDLTLVTDNDLPWVAEEGMRDGPQVRQPVRQALCRMLDGAGLPWMAVSGSGTQRLDCAWAAVRARWPQVG